MKLQQVKRFLIAAIGQAQISAGRGAVRRERKNRRQTQVTRDVDIGKVRAFFKVMGLGGLLGVAAVAMLTFAPQVQSWASVPISEIEFSGFSGGEFSGDMEHGASEEELLEIALPFMGDSYWHVSVQKLRQAVEQHPWVRQATVRKRWPEKLWVGIDEYVPVARWNDRQLLSMNGELFDVEEQSSFGDLPRFNVPWVLQPNPEMVRDLVGHYNEFQRELGTVGLQIEEMRWLTADNILLRTEKDLSIYLGTSNHLDRIRRLIVLVDAVGPERLKTMQKIDLRYSNGIATREKGYESPDAYVGLVDSSGLTSRISEH